MAAPRTARCGTDSGYKRHRKLGQEACAACLRAHADANTARRVSNGYIPRKAARCTGCGGETRTHHEMCSLCRKARDRAAGHTPVIDRCPDCGGWRSDEECSTCLVVETREPVWVLRGGVWRAVPTGPVDEFPSPKSRIRSS